MTKGASNIKVGQNVKEVRIRIGIWTAIRDMAITAMAKGQLLLLAVCAVFVIFACRMPNESIPVFFDKIIDCLTNLYVLGYVLWIGTVFLWFFHTRWQRKFMHIEMERVTQERNRYQKKSMGEEKITSSRE